MSILNEKQFRNEAAAYAWVEARVWPNGPVCPHCGDDKKVYELKGASTRIGLKKCGACRKPFTVKVGTIFEDSHIKMHAFESENPNTQVLDLGNRTHQIVGYASLFAH